MKKLTVTIIVILLNSILLFAQAPDTLWTKTYDYSFQDIGYSVQQTSDGGYIMVGSSRSYQHIDLLLLKTNSLGDTLWTKIFDAGLDEGSTVHYSVQQTSDGGYFITGTRRLATGLRRIYIIKTNSYGDSIWTRTFGNGNVDVFGYSGQSTFDGGYIVTGVYSNYLDTNSVYLLKTDGNGELAWFKSYNVGTLSIGYSVQQTSDYGFIVAGRRAVIDMNLFLLKTDYNGDEIWSTIYGGTQLEEGYFVEQTSDRGYIAVGRKIDDILLVRTNENGDILWDKTYGPFIGNCVRQTSDGGFIFTGETANPNKVLVVKVDEYGNELWSKTFPEQTDFRGGGYSLQQTSDGGYIVVGTSHLSGSGDIGDFYLIKLDSEPELNLIFPNGGEYWLTGTSEAIVWSSEKVDDVKIELSIDNGASWNTIVDSMASTGIYSWTVNSPIYSDECLIKVSKLSNPGFYDESDTVFTIDIVQSVELLSDKGIPDEFMLFQNFPNPFNPTTTIHFAIPQNCFVELKIYDVLGREVSTLISEFKEPGYYNYNLNAEELSSGIYFYTINAGVFAETKKMLLLK